MCGIQFENLLMENKHNKNGEKNNEQRMDVSAILRQYKGQTCEFQIILYGNGKDYEIAEFTVNGYADKTTSTRCDCTVPPWSVRMSQSF